MSQTHHIVKLIKNQLYPTYQLHAYMANSKTTPQEGLRLAALITMEWLRQRLGDHVPEELLCLPTPSAYTTSDNTCLPSLHVNAGFVIDIVSLPENGIWTLQITEPDLGSDPGNPKQIRQAVPGRVIETNVGYRISDTQLECGFQTVISDPEGTEQAEVYRLAIIRRLIENPNFGLRQLTKLTEETISLSTVEQVKKLLSIWKNQDNQLPCVVFTRYRENKEDNVPFFVQQNDLRDSWMPKIPLDKIPVQMPKKAGVPYQTEDFARSGVTFFRSYSLEDALFERFISMVGISAQCGDILILNPLCYGGKIQIVPYKSSSARRAVQLEQLSNELRSYSRNKQVSFGTVQFLSMARKGLIQSSEDIVERSAKAEEKWEQKLAFCDVQWKETLKKKDQECQSLKEQLERQRLYQDRIDKEKEELRKEIAAERQKIETILAEKDEDIAYLKRKLSQPKEHSRIAEWVEENFTGRILLHPKAKALLEDRSARSISVDLICDALDFLATDYWERRYERISTDEMNNRCSEKYGRPFEVKPTGTTTVEFTPTQYKVKYFQGAAGKPVECPLDFHLGVGNDPENLLRIYFLHDDAKKLIVVGSLPRHLKAVTIK